MILGLEVRAFQIETTYRAIHAGFDVLRLESRRRSRGARVTSAGLRSDARRLT